MGTEKLATGPASLDATLKVISFKGSELPENYHAVVIARWLNSLNRLNRYFKLIDRDAYYGVYEKFIKAILARPDVTVKLAALAEDIDVIFGWSVHEDGILHYVHVQEPYRKQGISYNLIPENTKIITHVTKHWEEYFMKNPKSKFKDLKFNPFIY